MILTKSVVSMFVLLSGYNAAPANNNFEDSYINSNANTAITSALTSVDNKGDVWDLTRNNLKLTKAYTKARVIKEIKKFNRNPYHMVKVSKSAAPYYYYVMQEVIKRDFPSEVALLPVIESLYNPNAYSSGKASGIWQFIPSTARYFGIEINSWYDGRRDVITSTNKALDYLTKLNKRFGGDWMLTFAAYNAGGGTVSKAMRKNREKGLATDFWSLKLPIETQHYVPRILAIGALVQNPEKYNIKIPAIKNVPFFKQVSLKGQIDLDKIAVLLSVDKAMVLKLNPGFNRNVSSAKGTNTFLVPAHKASVIETANIASYKPDSYKIKSGDSLGVIAEQFGLSVKSLKKANALIASNIKVGRTLYIPAVENTESPAKLAKNITSVNTGHKVHTINNGDTIWHIARKHKLSMTKVLAFNGLSIKSTLKVGSSLKIPNS